MKSFCLLFFLLGVVYGVKAAGKVCTENSQCQPGECCQIMSEFQIVSKRDLVNKLTKSDRTGTCESYKLEGESCVSFAKANGYCSCEPGTRCKTFEVKVTPTKTGSLLRRDMPRDRPGFHWVSKCLKQNV